MFRQSQYNSRRRWLWLMATTVGLAVFFMTLPGVAADIVRVEEEWELAVATPDPTTDAPQVTCLFSPRGDIVGIHATFELNQRSLPDFAPGGLQLQVWNGESPLSRTESPSQAVLGQADETVRWTQSMEIAGGVLKFAVSNGHSATWGDFSLVLQTPTSLTNLNQYDPAVSVKNSAVGFAANRVKSLVLKRVRYITATGDVWEDSTTRTVYTLPQ